MSGPIGDNYTIEKEDEDLDAIIKKTGSHYVFGTADGALFALHAAITNSDIHKVVAYEPLIFFGQPGIEEFKTIIQHYDEHMAEGDVAAAMESLTKDSKKYMVINIAPDFILVPIFKLALKLMPGKSRVMMYLSRSFSLHYTTNWKSFKKQKEHWKTTKMFLQKYYCWAAAKRNPC